MARVLIPLPLRDFDPTEAAVPFTLLQDAGHEVIVATPTGSQPVADERMCKGVLFGQIRATGDALARYERMQWDPSFVRPLRWDEIAPETLDALVLPGGHAPGMKPYLESEMVREIATAVMQAGKPVVAICHGVLVLARARDGAGRSLLHGRQTTCLPKYMERSAYFATAWQLGRYFRTYPAYVEDEVRAALGDAGKFLRGPVHLFHKGTLDDDAAAFVVEDGNYLSARWPGDAYLLAKRLVGKLRS